jgi:FixJ family two-component response regulator
MYELWESIQQAIRLDEKKWLERQQHEANSQRLASLSPAEREVFDRLLTGKTNKMIAKELGLSVRTVEERRGKLIKKLGVQTRAVLVEFAATLAEPHAKGRPPDDGEAPVSRDNRSAD